MKARNGMTPVHPGEILKDELDDLGLSIDDLSQALGVGAERISAIVDGERNVSADTALRLSRLFGTTPALWRNLQQS